MPGKKEDEKEKAIKDFIVPAMARLGNLRVLVERLKKEEGLLNPTDIENLEWAMEELFSSLWGSYRLLMAFQENLGITVKDLGLDSRDKNERFTQDYGTLLSEGEETGEKP
ncbi:MAG TPA: hypothetical protein P5274_03320 [Candidatus Paceibacterota bacterium]|nr:hypothetical protein [Candidatus Paceibacterota bacterium]